MLKKSSKLKKLLTVIINPVHCKEGDKQVFTGFYLQLIKQSILSQGL